MQITSVVFGLCIIQIKYKFRAGGFQPDVGSYSLESYMTILALFKIFVAVTAKQPTRVLEVFVTKLATIVVKYLALTIRRPIALKGRVAPKRPCISRGTGR
jgi:hypothetical protein